MAFTKPMLASPLRSGFTIESGVWRADEKIDGIRIIAEVNANTRDLFDRKAVIPWSRNEIIHPLPEHIVQKLSDLPDCILDGEIYVPGKRSYGATELVNQQDLIFGVFDIIEFEGEDVKKLNLNSRRRVLNNILNTTPGAVHLIPSTPVDSMDEVYALRDEVWARDGEGLILKRKDSIYQPNKRNKDWIKIKALRSNVLTVIGFAPSRGLINDRGPYAMAIIQDEDENITTVKTRNDAECRLLEKTANPVLEWREFRYLNRPMKMIVNHPSVGRKLRIEFQERTPDGSYRHPRWDRWEDE